jgi:hypothetical protein
MRETGTPTSMVFGIGVQTVNGGETGVPTTVVK